MQRALGPFTISAIGFGCMNVSHGYLPRPDKAASIKVLNAALDAGYTHLDTAALYGFGANEEIVGEAVMLFLYFVVFLSFGLWFRLIGRDALKLRIDRNQESYWEDRPPKRKPQDYYRQS